MGGLASLTNRPSHHSKIASAAKNQPKTKPIKAKKTKAAVTEEVTLIRSDSKSSSTGTTTKRKSCTRRAASTRIREAEANLTREKSSLQRGAEAAITSQSSRSTRSSRSSRPTGPTTTSRTTKTTTMSGTSLSISAHKEEHLAGQHAEAGTTTTHAAVAGTRINNVMMHNTINTSGGSSHITKRKTILCSSSRRLIKKSLVAASTKHSSTTTTSSSTTSTARSTKRSPTVAHAADGSSSTGMARCRVKAPGPPRSLQLTAKEPRLPKTK